MSDETTVAQDEDLTILPDFSDWIGKTQLSKDRENVRRRWKTIERLFLKNQDDIEYEFMDSLILSSLTHLVDTTQLNNLRQEIKKDDFMFPNAEDSNLEELQALSVYSLRLLCDRDTSVLNKNDSISLTTQILSTSFGGTRSFVGGVELFSFVKGLAFDATREQRKFKHVQAPKFILDSDKATKEALSTLDENAATAPQAIQQLNKEMQRQLRTVQTNMTKYVNSVNEQTKIAEEELEILWFADFSWCEACDVSYNDLSEFDRIVYCALELMNKTKFTSELPSVKAIANKVGVASSNITYKEWVEAVAKNVPIGLNEYIENASLFTPALYGVKLACNGNWLNSWKTSIGLDYNLELSAQDFVLQLYRELLVINREL